MLSSAPPPPKAEKLSCSEFPAPVDVPVVESANSAEDGMPKRTSLPSRFAPAARAAGPVGFASATQMTASIRPHSEAITPSSAAPWRIPDGSSSAPLRLPPDPTMRPNVRVSDTGMSSRKKISRKSVRPVGFSNGCAELALRIPPPLVPSSLIDSCDATGARAMVDVLPSGPGARAAGVGSPAGAERDEDDRADAREGQQHPAAAGGDVAPRVAEPVRAG